jgi:hypothetical protein
MIRQNKKSDMTNYLIGYDLDRPDLDYGQLINAIKELGNWRHCLDSIWIVRSTLSAGQIRDTLWRHMGNRDRLLVSALSTPVVWHGFDDACSSWLKANL